jgi:multidrug efflux pump subunit AcrA (membrane-fusion protein)
MNRRTALIIAAGVLAAGFIISVVLSNQRKPLKRRSVSKKQEIVTAITVRNDVMTTTLGLTGPLSALDQVDVYAEVAGVLLSTGKRFKPGNSFRRNEPLIRIDDSVYRNNLLAQKSGLLNQLTLLLPDLSIDFPERAGKWHTYLDRFELEKPLVPLPELGSEKERYYIASRNIYSQFYNIKSMEATLAKYTIRAPYDGVVTSSSINPGTLVRQGQKLGEFVSTSVYEVEVFAGLDEVKHISVGLDAVLTCDDLPGEFQGTVSRVNEVIEKSTQTVAVYITTTDERLRNGLYMSARIKSNPIDNAVRVPVSALAGESQVWVLKDSALKLVKVEVAAVENGQVLIRGLADGTILVLDPPTDASPGLKIPPEALSIPGGGKKILITEEEKPGKDESSPEPEESE